ncbi:tetratricopeptide repeat protein [Roseibium litorale]|uniref:Tetratricopeptide repeat protein n=1 Tax=Roseibium litorale TaxID=2803841 RepID=A0ABR9CQ76_9HYPH|nr:tetratricopeptide repeat protein [Roseibium litorale]MBD8892824.1 tetratricopeptide repeat protein [Roseibium litorale]
MAPKTPTAPLLEKMHKALALQKAGEFAKAQKIYKLVLKKLPGNADANHLLGVSYRQLGDPETAIKYIEKAIKLSPNQGVFYSNLARAHSDIPASGPQVILENAEKALSLSPNIVEAYNLKAIALTKLERQDEAEEIFKLLISKVPSYADANSNYGLLLRDQKRYEEAVRFFDNAVKLEPGNPENYIQRARARLKAETYEISKTELPQALELFKDNSDLQHEMARLLYKTGDPKGALPFAKAAVKDGPEDPHRLTTLGVTHQSLGNFGEALKHFLKASELIGSVDPAVEWNMSLAYLGLGDLENGWRLHPARLRKGIDSTLKRKFLKPEWDGSDLTGKTIMVWNDQGIGDAFRFGSIIHDLIKAAGNVIIEVSQKLIPPFQRTFPDATVRLATFESLTLNATCHDYDYQFSMGDLGMFYRRSYADFETARQPGFVFDKRKARAFHERIPEARDKPIVGLAWRSRNLAPSRARFYLSVPELAPLLETPEVTFINLQYARIDREVAFLRDGRGYNFIDFEDLDLMNDLEAAAALTACCDLVIGANTSPAELAGCYGIPCWRFGPPETQLLLGQASPPWYPKTEYFTLSADQPAMSIIPFLHEKLRNWISAGFSPNERLGRLGLLESEQE